MVLLIEIELSSFRKASYCLFPAFVSTLQFEIRARIRIGFFFFQTKKKYMLFVTLRTPLVSKRKQIINVIET